MQTTNVSNLKINVLSQEQYDRIKTAGTINDNEIYMTPTIGSSLDNYLPLISSKATITNSLFKITENLAVGTQSNDSTTQRIFSINRYCTASTQNASATARAAATKWSIRVGDNGSVYIAQNFNATNDNYGYDSSDTNAMTFAYNKITSSKPFYGAVWNDYAEYRKADSIEPGRCIIENGDDSLSISSSRMQPGAEIISDTFGFAIGETDECETPVAASGRVLAYTFEDREEYRKAIGRPVCSGPNGTISLMTDEEYQKQGYCAIGFVSAVPDYDEWGTGKIKVNNRVWIRIK